MRIYHDFLVRREDPFGRPYYWIGGETPSGNPEEGTDIGDLSAGYISITPIHLDMTAHNQLEMLRTWVWPQVKRPGSP
jgi:5'-nucleotidase